jgi:23S rRNA pseudouridine1911/1915/1917 synthase
MIFVACTDHMNKQAAETDSKQQKLMRGNDICCRQNKTNQKSFVVPQGYERERIDVAISSFAGCSRSHAQTLIDGKYVFCNGTLITKPKICVHVGDEITYTDEKVSNLTPSNIALNIVFEDDHIIVVDKPAGMVVHPAPGHYTDTLANAVLAHCESIAGVGAPTRPGIIHRLDKDTSGLLLVAKTNEAHTALSKNLRPCITQLDNSATRAVKRTYIAIVHGTLQPLCGTISSHIARDKIARQKMRVTSGSSGKLAVTQYETKKVWQIAQPKGKEAGLSVSLVQFRLLTGRTHQIRVHCQSIGHQIVGDQIYNRKSYDKRIPRGITSFPRQALHSSVISFEHPISNEFLEFTSTIPDDIEALMQELQVLCLNEQ